MKNDGEQEGIPMDEWTDLERKYQKLLAARDLYGPTEAIEREMGDVLRWMDDTEADAAEDWAMDRDGELGKI
jgi:hypothetical protein